MTAVVRLAGWRDGESKLSDKVHDSIPVRVDSALEFVSLNDTYAYATAALVWTVGAVWRRLNSLVVLVVGACVSGFVAFAIVRSAFDWSRPPEYDPLGMGPSWEFPSGHAFGSSLIATLVTGSILAADSDAPRRWVAWAWVWAGTVGLLKFVEGNHYLGDIVVGWLMGCAWGCAAFTVFIASSRPSPHTVGRHSL